MKILFVCPSFGAFGGMEAFVIAVAKSLQGRAEVRVFFKAVANSILEDRFRAVLQESGLVWMWGERASGSLVKAIHWADVVHCQNPCPDVVLTARLCFKPICLTIHNWLRRDGSWRTLVWRFCAGLARRRWYNSTFVAGTWEPSGLRSGSAVIPTVSEIEYDFAPFPGRQGFVFLARWIENKGADTLLKAYAKARFEKGHHPLVMMGDGPEREKLLKECGIPEGVTVTGFVSTKEKMRRIRAARWLVVPPNTKEDMGLTPIEARANGIAVIASLDGGVPEAAGSSAIFCLPGSVESLCEALEKAVQMPDDEYRKRAITGFESLKKELVPLSFYEKNYEEMVRSTSVR